MKDVTEGEKFLIKANLNVNLIPEHSQEWIFMSTRGSSQLNNETIELSDFLHQYGVYVLDGLKDKIKDGCHQWLSELKAQHLGQAYVDMLEKNLIFYAECWHVGISELTTHILSKKDVSESYVEKHLQNSLSIVKSYVPCHQEFIHNGCRGCAVHNGHDFYTALKGLYEGENIEEYIDELEFSCLYYKACFLIIQLYINTYVPNIDSFTPFNSMPTYVLAEALATSVKVHTNYCLDEVQIELDVSDA